MTTFLFGVFYWPPSGNVNSLLALNKCLMSQYPLVICGDFNAPAIDWSTVSPTVSSHVANTMCDLVRENFLLTMFLHFFVLTIFSDIFVLCSQSNIIFLQILLLLLQM